MTAEQAFMVLGIHDRNIDEAELKRAFREAARNTHPDSNPDDEYAQNRFQMINDAYKVLCDFLKLQKHDKSKEYKDKWDYYAQADRKFAEEKKKRASERAKEELERKLRYERMQKEREERLERERLERAQLERERLKRERLERERLEKERMAMLKKKLDVVKEELFLELCLVFIVAVVVCGEIVSLPFVGLNKLGIYSSYIATAVSWVFILLFAKKITGFTMRFFKGKIEQILTFLISVELGLSLLKLIQYEFDGVRPGVTSIIIIMAVFIFESSYIGKIKENISVSTKNKRIIAKWLAGEYLFVTLSGIVFGLISLIRG